MALRDLDTYFSPSLRFAGDATPAGDAAPLRRGGSDRRRGAPTDGAAPRGRHGVTHTMWHLVDNAAIRMRRSAPWAGRHPAGRALSAGDAMLHGRHDILRRGDHTPATEAATSSATKATRRYKP